MKIHKQKKAKKSFILFTALAVIALLLIALYLYLNRGKSTDEQKKQTDSFQSDRDQNKNIKDNPTVKQEAPNTDKPNTPQENTTSGKQHVEMTASVNSTNGTVYIRGGINYPVTDGNCYAQLHGPAGQTIKKDTTLLTNPASTDCKTIAIPVEDLSTGVWRFTLHYISSDYEGSSSEITFST